MNKKPWLDSTPACTLFVKEAEFPADLAALLRKPPYLIDAVPLATSLLTNFLAKSHSTLTPTLAHGQIWYVLQPPQSTAQPSQPWLPSSS